MAEKKSKSNKRNFIPTPKPLIHSNHQKDPKGPVSQRNQVHHKDLKLIKGSVRKSERKSKQITGSGQTDPRGSDNPRESDNPGDSDNSGDSDNPGDSDKSGRNINDIVGKFIKECVQRDGIIYTIPKDDNEPMEVYLDRVNYITQKMKACPNLMAGEIIRRSRLWRNINIYNMRFPSTVTRLI